MGKVSAVIRLTRAEHSLMLVLAVLAAELIAGGFPSPLILAASLITPIFISMSAFAINDYFDIEVDRINHKLKAPLVSGELTSQEALYVTIACVVIGVGASLLINVNCFVIALVFATLAMLYSYRLKEIPLVGSAYIAFSMAIPFIYGSYVVTNSIALPLMLVSLMIFLSGVAREIHGTIRDLAGDTKVRKVRSLPSLLGVRVSAYISLLAYAAAMTISVDLFLRVAPFAGNLVYLAVIAVSDLMLSYVVIGYLVTDTHTFYRRARNISLAAMGLALLAILCVAV